MKRMVVLMALLIGGIASGVVPSGWAAEEKGSLKKTAPASTKPSAANPSLLTAQGVMSALNLTASPAQLTITTGTGTLTLTFDPKVTTVWKEGVLVRPSQLQAGQRVKVRYMERNGRQIAKTISIQSPAKPATTATPPTPPHHAAASGATASGATSVPPKSN